MVCAQAMAVLWDNRGVHRADGAYHALYQDGTCAAGGPWHGDDQYRYPSGQFARHH